ncbi:epoxide hydrolase family protein [Sphingomonas sp. UYP23]
MTILPFEIRISDDKIDDLHRRLNGIRWPEGFGGDGWGDGASLTFMKRLVDHWLHRFDWRSQETRLNRLPNMMTTVDGQGIHFVHQRGLGPSPMPIVVTHGWPGSFVEMEQLIPLLADPAANGGDPADAFHVVVPSLPGYGFSPAPSEPGIGSREIAGLWTRLMAELGYDRFGAQGGDIGAGVSAWLARLVPGATIGIHLNYIPGSYRPPIGGTMPAISTEEQAFLDHTASWSAAEGAYAALQGTKPQTLAFSLTDSPLGLAAWITEKVRSWSDCGGDVESVISLDTLLTDISLYWFGNALPASLRLYKENRQQPLVFRMGERVSPPVGVALFPRELPMPPRSWVERVFDVTRWTTMPVGGHFAALEQPHLLAEEIRAFFRPLRTLR